MLALENNAAVVKRDAPSATTSKDASASIDEALQSFKAGLNDLVKNIQNNEIFQNVSTSLKSFGESVQKQGQELVAKLSENTTPTP